MVLICTSLVVAAAGLTLTKPPAETVAEVPQTFTTLQVRRQLPIPVAVGVGVLHSPHISVDTQEAQAWWFLGTQTGCQT